MSERNFRRYVLRYEAEGLDGLVDRRIEQVSKLRAAVDEVIGVVDLYQGKHDGWNVAHFYQWYKRQRQEKQEMVRSYTWVKNRLQEASVVPGGGRAAVSVILYARREETYPQRRALVTQTTASVRRCG